MEARTTELFNCGRVVVYTDGACRDNQYQKLRRAGVGVFWARNHSMNISRPLPGAWQSNQRAELLAIFLAVRAEARPLEVRTDSQYVCDGWARFISGHVRTSWYGIPHADIWRQIVAEMSGR
eukprot:9787509-Karenia_brevis.AAC.1